MIRVGVTGGIGSGKTTVCTVLEILGVPVYYADDRAKELMANSPDLKKSITQTFGEESYTAGNLNREFLSQTVFNDPAELAKLNALVHPAVQSDFEAWTQQQSAPYIVKEAALIYEAGSDQYLDKVIVVTANEEERISRIMLRDGVTRESVVARMKNQMPEDEKVKRADYVIDNSGTVLVLPQVLKIHELLKLET